MGAAEVKHDGGGNAPTPDGHLDLASLLLTVVRDVLEQPTVSLDDDFFTAGGDSLLAMHVVGRLSHASGLRVRVSHLFAHPVLREFAAALGQLRGAQPLGAAQPAGGQDTVVPLAAALRMTSTEGGSDAL
jgi:aryl carrier-like protein